MDVARAGDRVEITGIYRAVPSRVSSRKRSLRSVYRTYIDIIHVRKTESGRLSVEHTGGDSSEEGHTHFNEGDDIEQISTERRRRLRQMSGDPELYDKLAQSLAPSIWELEDVKKVQEERMREKERE